MNRVSRAAIALLMFATPVLPAQAHGSGDVFYKCVSSTDAVSYQQTPCSGKDKTAWSRDLQSSAATPSHPVPKTPAEVARDREAQQKESRASLARQAAAADAAAAAAKPARDARTPQQVRCDEATLARDAWERQNGSANDLDRLRALNDAIFEACKGL